MRLSGHMTVAAGVLLAAVTVLQAEHLWRLSVRTRRQCLRAEMRGLTQALRWRLERDLLLRDHNRPAMKRALEEVITGSGKLQWAALHDAGAGRLAATGPAPDLAPEALKDARGTSPEDLPILRLEAAGGLLGLTRLRLAEREMVLAAGPPAGAPLGSGGSALPAAGALFAGLAAALLLVVRGAGEIAARRRRAGHPPTTPDSTT